MSKPEKSKSAPAPRLKNTDYNRKALKDSIERFHVYTNICRKSSPNKTEKKALAYFLIPMSNSKE